MFVGVGMAGSRLMKYVFPAAWTLGAIICLVNGIFALLPPTRWLRSTWNSARVPGLDNHPGMIRLIGALAVVIGSLWLMQGVHLALGR